MIEFYNSLKWYPLILIVGWTPSTIVRVYQMAGGFVGPNIGAVFKLVTGMFLQGVLNAAAYGFTPVVREKWTFLLSRVWQSRDIVPIFQMEGGLGAALRESFFASPPIAEPARSAAAGEAALSVELPRCSTNPAIRGGRMSD
jgi:hypothetical protein